MQETSVFFYHDIFMQKQIKLHLTTRHIKIQKNRKYNTKKASYTYGQQGNEGIV